MHRPATRRSAKPHRDTTGVKAGYFVPRLFDQLVQPVVQFLAAWVGQRVHGAFGALPVAAGLLLVDEAGLGQLFGDHVKRAVVELDASAVAVVAQGSAQFVGCMGRWLR
jgi:hypothetical protein